MAATKTKKPRQPSIPAAQKALYLSMIKLTTKFLREEDNQKGPVPLSAEVRKFVSIINGFLEEGMCGDGRDYAIRAGKELFKVDIDLYLKNDGDENEDSPLPTGAAIVSTASGKPVLWLSTHQETVADNGTGGLAYRSNVARPWRFATDAEIDKLNNQQLRRFAADLKNWRD